MDLERYPRYSQEGEELLWIIIYIVKSIFMSNLYVYMSMHANISEKAGQIMPLPLKFLTSLP